MTAPKPLPRCPVCYRKPIESREPWHARDRLDEPPVWTIDCYANGQDTHRITIYGASRAEARARWRRLAGGAK